MRQPSMLLAALVTALISGFNCSGLVSADSAPSKGETRTIDFHSEQSLGSLSLAKREDEGIINPSRRAVTDRTKPIGPARGIVNIQVPHNTMLSFEPNRRIFDNPKLMDNIPDKIDILYVRTSAADDSEIGRSDKLLLHLGNMQNLRELYTSRSDVTDRGLTQLPTLKKLEVFGA